MKKKLLSLLLTFALLFSLCPAALAAEDEPRETDFFTDQEHTDLNFADMQFERVDGEQFLADIAAVQALLEDEANAEAVEESFYDLMERSLDLATMYRLASIKTSQDVMDEEAIEDLSYTNEVYDKVWDALSLFIQAALSSPCGEFLQDVLTEEDIVYFTEYTKMTDEQFEMSTKENDLQAEFNQAYIVTYTHTDSEGTEWNDDSIYEAYTSGTVDEETYTEISREIAKAKNAALGEIYIRLVELRKAIAASYGYDNYAAYSYEEAYQRDFTPEDAQTFHQAVKDNGFYDIYTALRMLWTYGRYDEANDALLLGDFAGDIALDMMAPYIAQMSSELLEAFTYMREHGFIDSDLGDNKDGSGFTTILNSYGAPFYFNTPTGTLYDFTTAVHEFGHYNNYYWQPCGWNDASKGIDLAEIHSQSLELLFAHFYPDLFGDNGQFVLDFQLMNLVSAICDGALYDELQQYVYATEDVTLEQINQKYRQLAGEYGLVPEDDPRTELYSWVDIHHNFTAPCYYISYGVSAPVALSFYLETLEGDYNDALDKYLAFTALSGEYSFQESLAELDLGNPMDAAYMEELAEKLWTDLELEARLEAIQQAQIAFSDVVESDWFYEYVMFMVTYGLVTGYEDGTFRPTEAATWGFAGVEGEDAETIITRLEFCQVLTASILEMAEGAIPDVESPFSDTDDRTVAALAELGIIGGYADGTFRPEDPMTRAELCTAYCRAMLLLLNGAGDAADTDAAA